MALAAEPSSRQVVPLRQQVWSAEAPDLVSENPHLLGMIDRMAAASFGAGWLGEGLKLGVLASRVLKVAKGFFGVRAFASYALADGLRV